VWGYVTNTHAGEATSKYLVKPGETPPDIIKVKRCSPDRENSELRSILGELSGIIEYELATSYQARMRTREWVKKRLQVLQKTAGTGGGQHGETFSSFNEEKRINP
jgi:hypothetical protein